MPKITAKSIYAIAAIYYLYQRKDQKPHSIEEIAAGANVPKNFLEQILLALKKSGILRSIRGAHGGYVFAKDPQAITFLQIVQAVESECCSDICKTHNPILELFWKGFAAHVRSYLDRPLTYFDELSTPNMFYI